MQKACFLVVWGALLASKKSSKNPPFGNVKNMVFLHAYHALLDLGPPRIEKKTLRKVNEQL